MGTIYAYSIRGSCFKNMGKLYFSGLTFPSKFDLEIMFQDMVKKSMLKNVWFLVLLLSSLAYTAQAQVLTVWPGDANNNGIVNHVDLLMIGRGMGEAGQGRDTISIAWGPHFLQGGWPQSNPLFPDLGYADCDGSGLIDGFDVNAVEQNYGLTWGGSVDPDSNTLVASGAPLIEIRMIPDSIILSGSTTVQADIWVGGSGAIVDSLYGIAFTLTFDTTLVDTVNLNLDGGWINFDTSSIQVSRIDYIAGRIEFALTRVNRSNAVNGYGSIGNISIVMDDNIRVASTYELPINIIHAHALTESGASVYLSPVNDTLGINTALTPPQSLPRIAVYPVPARSELRIRAEHLQNVELSIHDTQGKLILQQTHETLDTHQISVAGWPAGIYILEIKTPEGVQRAKLTIAPE